ncbi:MAG: N-acetyl-gamma-glutamyl-phosphate reductase [Cyclobacteriaceae bacterium]|nr:N-acetyl-gamma-glutamyl-phosphate reductase [Cyclobacteriaceae bacterium]
MRTNKIKVGIIGAAGYTGGEMLRLLLQHPDVEIVCAQSRSQADKSISAVHKDLLGETDLQFASEIKQQVDVLFLCLSHGESKEWLKQNSLPTSTKVIDLGNDFRIDTLLGEREFVYGLPELYRDNIRNAQNIANPGCFATAIQLSLLPLAKEKALSETFVTGITGSTGAGQKLQDTSHFTWRSHNVSAYKTLTHQHLGEITKSIQHLHPSFQEGIHFVPWRGDFTRGIFTSSVITCDMTFQEVNDLYLSYYTTHPFTHITPATLDLKQVINTNKCVLQLEKVGNKLVIHAAIDNLIKGASGQAIQNMNLLFDLDETSGLKIKASAF